MVKEAWILCWYEIFIIFWGIPFWHGWKGGFGSKGVPDYPNPSVIHGFSSSSWTLWHHTWPPLTRTWPFLVKSWGGGRSRHVTYRWNQDIELSILGLTWPFISNSFRDILEIAKKPKGLEKFLCKGFVLYTYLTTDWDE
jgi:hypothetical protein